MSNAFFKKGKENILGGDIDWDAHNQVAMLVDSADYTINLNTHDALDDIAVAGRVATSGNLASKTKTDGKADAADFTFTTVTGDPSEYLIFRKETGVEATSLLICAFDTATGLPITPNSADINVTLNASGIFEI